LLYKWREPPSLAKKRILTPKKEPCPPSPKCTKSKRFRRSSSFLYHCPLQMICSLKRIVPPPFMTFKLTVPLPSGSISKYDFKLRKLSSITFRRLHIPTASHIPYYHSQHLHHTREMYPKPSYALNRHPCTPWIQLRKFNLPKPLIIT
jgi:hypothetical protein